MTAEAGGGGWDEPPGPPAGGLGEEALEGAEEDAESAVAPGEVLAELEAGGPLPSRERLRSLSGAPDDVLSRFVALWPRLDPERRRALLTALMSLGEEDATLDFHRISLTALLDGDAATRILAVRGLRDEERPEYLRLLLDRLREEGTPAVRAELADVLGRFVVSMEFGMLDEDDSSLLAGGLRDVAEEVTEPDELRARALEALGASGEEWVSELIADFYQSGSDRLRLGALRAMGRNARDEWLPVLLAAFEEEDPELRAAAATSAGVLLLDDAVDPLLLLALGDGEPEVQLAAVAALGEIGTTLAIRVLRRLTREGPSGVAETAREALSRAEMVPLSGFEAAGDGGGEEGA
ncbi:MAG: HEAT repeat domain-containing protein [Chloroflexi bacterium]|nr:HEAT repeat domain-containing protein [Chloroflexota bacterium]